jgi:hypothetical protein
MMGIFLDREILYRMTEILWDFIDEKGNAYMGCPLTSEAKRGSTHGKLEQIEQSN